MKSKLKKIISILLIELIILLPIAMVDALTITNVRVEEVTDISAKVKWDTDIAAEESVNFGTTQSLGRTESTPNSRREHSILLNNINPDTPYYFEVVSNSITDNNNGNFHTFTTLPETALFVSSNIPENYKQHSINIEGSSIRLARINMYANSATPRTLNSDNNGNFLFPNTDLNEGDNTIRLTAESQGQIVEQVYSINVDTIAPTVTLTEIPNVVGEERITINGSVSELVDISIYVTSGEEDTTPPPKVANLKNTSVQANLVELNWDEISTDDFQQYIVYRNNKPLGIGSDSDYNDYSDVLANSGQTYIYEVAAMDRSGNIGSKSNPLTITTPEGGRTDLPEEDVDIYEGTKGLEKTITTDTLFEEEIQIGAEDGFYNIKIEAIDKSDNKWTYEKDVLLDTEPPEIEIISPKSNAEIFENYADNVAIRGKTEPGARVYLYVKRTPFSISDDTVDISGFPDQIQDIKETDLRADCRVNIRGEEQCKTHSDYETIADAEGFFEFEEVDMTSMWAGALRIEEYETGEPYYDQATRPELRDVINSNLLFVAVDLAGKKGTEQINYQIGTCWSPGFAWDATPLIEYQSPTFLNVERLKEGTETIYFYFNFTYHGRAKDAKITSLRVDDACGQGYLENQKRYNYSCSILRSCTEKLSPNGKTAYIACPLGRLEEIGGWDQDEWQSFIDTIANEMTFPFKLTMTYDEEFDNSSIDYSNTHYLCTEVGYVVDAAVINAKDILPDWMLYDLTDYLNSSINKMEEWMEKIRQVLEWTAIGCMVTFFVKFMTQIFRRWTCFYDRFFKNLQQLASGGNKEDECRKCIDEKEQPESRKKNILKRFDNKKDVQDLISDKCMETCYPSCSSSWKSEESLYTTYRWACDRVFGHAAPSGWTETVSDQQLFQKLSEGSSCADDQSVRGRPLRAVECKKVEDKYRIKDTFSRDDKCLEITSHTQSKRTETLYFIDKPYSEGESVYKISKMDTSAPSLTYDFVIKQNENNYLAPMEQSCEEICRGDLLGNKVQLGLKPVGGKKNKIGENVGKGIKSNKLPEDTSSIEKEDGETKRKENMMTYGCITPNECISYKSGDQRKIPIEGSKEEFVDVKTAVPMGYTSDCFDPRYVSGDPDTRIECCCINSKTGASPEYYQPEDVEGKDGEFGNTQLNNMKWSYRYWKMGYKSKKYNENRYIQGRDYTACFGQNNWLYDGLSTPGETGNLLIIDPMKQHIAAFQCLAISQILNRLALIKNIMVALQNCLLSIRVTGDADTGVCKEIFTQYICAFVWKIITWIRNGCLPFGKGIDLGKSENEILEALSVGTDSLWDSVADSQEELASEYGNAQLNNLIGIGEEELFRKVCLAAFGYDWEIDLESFVDVAYTTPYATLVQAILPSREYITFDPTTYNARYEYRSSWLINPGCDLDNYEVYLTCVTRNDIQNYPDINCAKQKDPYGKNCDCLDLPPDKAPPPEFFYQSRSKIEQNNLVQVDSTQIADRIKSTHYRYDHIMFKLRVDRNFKENKGNTANCFPDNHEDGTFYFPITDFTAREVGGCSTDVASGKFSCRQGASFFYEEGNAWFTEIQIGNSTITNIQRPQGATFYSGSNDPINAVVKYQKDERKQCLITRLMDKGNSAVINAPAAIELREKELNGEERIGNLYSIGEKDITGGGYGFTINYLNEEGRTMPAAAKLSYTQIKKADKDGPGGPLSFNDNDGNGRIDVSRSSSDSYSYRGDTKKISESYSRGRFEIELKDIGAVIRIDKVDQTTNGNYEFFIQYIGGTNQQSTLEPKFYLHLDLRYPLEPNGDCDVVRGIEYDESQVIVSNGIPQKVDIPIYVLPGTSTTGKCPAKNEYYPLSGKDNQCVCGDRTTNNCPRSNLNYCYGVCREYPRCEFNTASTTPCVCNPDSQATKFDCGGPATNVDAVPPENRAGWYCYQKPDAKNPTCNQQLSSGIPTTSLDSTPLQITLNFPQPNNAEPYTVIKGQKIIVQAIIQDDITTGSEEYEIVIREGNNRNTLPGTLNTQKLHSWDIYKEIETNNLDPGSDIFIFIEGTDGSMRSVSGTSHIKISAPI
jgi:hypothetical protein